MDKSYTIEELKTIYQEWRGQSLAVGLVPEFLEMLEEDNVPETEIASLADEDFRRVEIDGKFVCVLTNVGKTKLIRTVNSLKKKIENKTINIT